MREDAGNCLICKHCILQTGAYTRTKDIGCELESAWVEGMTQEQLLEQIKNPKPAPCRYEKGNPQDGGITLDD